jgi:hypothetical protein
MPENIAVPAPSPPGREGTAERHTAPDGGAEPRQGECLRCYLLRMLNGHGCDGTHRWTIRWRDTWAPGATTLLRKLARRGGCCCDCEVVFNVWRDYEEDAGNLPCAGVPVGVTEPCRLPPAHVQ